MPPYTASFPPSASASTLRMSMRPPPVYTWSNSGEKSSSVKLYSPKDRYCRSVPAHCCTKIHAVRDSAPSNWVNCAAWNDTNNWSREAWVGALGSSVRPGPVRKLSQAVDATATSSATSALRVNTVFMVAPALTVQGDGEHERASLRVVEIVHSAQAHLRPGQVGFGVDPGVLGPGLEVTTGHPQVDAAQAEQSVHPLTVERVADGDLPQLDEAAVLDELGRDGAKPRSETGEPRLSDLHLRAGPRPTHRPRQIALPEHHAVAADLGVLVGAEVVEGALGAIPDLAAMLDVEQARDGPLLVPQRRADAAGPLRGRVHDHADLGILDREARRVDV